MAQLNKKTTSPHFEDQPQTQDVQDDAARPMTQKIGAWLIAQHGLAHDQLQIGLHEQKRTNERIGQSLVRLGFVKPQIIANALASQANVDSIDLKSASIDQNIIERVPLEIRQRIRAMPITINGNDVTVAMSDPFDILAIDEIRRHFPHDTNLVIMVACDEDIDRHLFHAQNNTASLDQILTDIQTGFSQDAAPFDHPVIQLVDHILAQAVEQHVSDIHFEPEENLVRIRYRLDGVLHLFRELHQAHWPALSHRIKILAGMNIAKTRHIQDGRFSQTHHGADIDFRVAIMPTSQGETIAIRILDHRRALRPMNELGYSADNISLLGTILNKPQGLTLLTGPTGSGKTTTLYAILGEINSPDQHIATLEEPIEYQLKMVRQTSIHEATGLTYAAGIRGLLRMDPDILLIGEIRDPDTAQMALRAAMTGHQVFSTLHCNNAIGALARLYDLGLTSRQLAGNLSGIVAQRLVRKLCPHCKTERRATNEESSLFLQTGLLAANTTPLVATTSGCKACHHTGRQGRTVIAEVIPIDPDLDDLITRDAPRTDLLTAAGKNGYRPMAFDGLRRILDGEIALDDLRRQVDLSTLNSMASR